MRKFMISAALLAAACGVSAHGGYDDILRQIEANSTTLQTMRRQTDAQKAGNRTGLTPADPEVEAGYLWGHPSSVGNRTDIGVRQTFDFPSAYVQRGRIADLRDREVELVYRSERAALLLSAQKTLVELTYRNALAAEWAARLRNAEQIARTFSARLKTGEGNAIENNKAQLNLQTVRGELARIETERALLLSELARMNGGQPVEFTDVSYPAYTLPSDFESWYAAAEAKSPVLQHLSTQVETASRQVGLDRSMALPRISVGYMSERVAGEHFRGVTAGVSIPLWENRGRVRQARAEVLAAGSRADEGRMQFRAGLESLYARALRLYGEAASYRDALSRYGNAALLDKALAAGEISLLEYLLEMEYYYTAAGKMMEVERDYRLAVAELSAAEL